MMKTGTPTQELIEELLSKTAEAPQREKEAPEDEEDPSKIKQRKPPSRGLCRRCGQNKPINRLMLCYPCWVKTELEDHGWREGMPHPSWCHCTGVDGHGRKSEGN